MKKLTFQILAVSVLFTACEEKQPQQPEVIPKVTIEEGTATETELSFTIRTENAEYGTFACLDSPSEGISAENILSEGKPVDVNTDRIYTVNGLEPGTEYTVLAAVVSDTHTVVSTPLVMKTLTHNEPEPETIEITFSGAEVNGDIAPSLFPVRLYDEAGNEALLNFCIADASSEVAPGIYMPGDEIAENTLYNSSIIYDDAEYRISNGTVEVSGSMDDWSLSMKLTGVSDSGTESVFTGSFKGSVDGLTQNGGEIDLSALTSADIWGELTPGHFPLYLTDDAWNIEASLYFNTPTDVLRLPAGKYEVGDDGDLFLSSESSISVYDGAAIICNCTIVSGAVDISDDNGIYTLIFNLHGSDDNGSEWHFTGTFTGEISGMPTDDEPITEKITLSFSQAEIQEVIDGCFYIHFAGEEMDANLYFNTYSDEVTLAEGSYIYDEDPSELSLESGSTIVLHSPDESVNTVTNGYVNVYYDSEYKEYLFDFNLFGEGDDGKSREFKGDFFTVLN